jgi:hypothetical protein
MENAGPITPPNSRPISSAPVVPKPRINSAPPAIISSVQSLFGKVVDGDESARQAKEWQEVFSHNGKLNKEKCSFRRVLQHLYIEEYFAVVDLPCGTWGCPTRGVRVEGLSKEA